MGMRKTTVGIRELKDRLSEYVKSVATGGPDVVITDRGRAVARLTQAKPTFSTAREPLRIRPAVKDHSDLSWLRRGAVRRTRTLDRAITETLDFIRADKELP